MNHLAIRWGLEFVEKQWDAHGKLGMSSKEKEEKKKIPTPFNQGSWFVQTSEVCRCVDIYCPLCACWSIKQQTRILLTCVIWIKGVRTQGERFSLSRWCRWRHYAANNTKCLKWIPTPNKKNPVWIFLSCQVWVCDTFWRHSRLGGFFANTKYLFFGVLLLKTNFAIWLARHTWSVWRQTKKRN